MVDKKISELPTRSPLDPADFLPLSGLNQSGQFATYKVSIGALANQIARTRIDNGAVTPSVIGLVDGQDVDQTAELFRSRPSTEMTGFVHTAGAIFIVPQAEWDNSWLASEIPPQYGANLGTEMSFTVTDLMGGSLLAGEYTLAIQDIFADPADKEVVSLARAYGNLNFIEAVQPPLTDETADWTVEGIVPIDHHNYYVVPATGDGTHTFNGKKYSALSRQQQTGKTIALINLTDKIITWFETASYTYSNCIFKDGFLYVLFGYTSPRSLLKIDIEARTSSVVGITGDTNLQNDGHVFFPFAEEDGVSYLSGATNQNASGGGYYSTFSINTTNNTTSIARFNDINYQGTVERHIGIYRHPTKYFDYHYGNTSTSSDGRFSEGTNRASNQLNQVRTLPEDLAAGIGLAERVLGEIGEIAYFYNDQDGYIYSFPCIKNDTTQPTRLVNFYTVTSTSFTKNYVQSAKTAGGFVLTANFNSSAPFSYFNAVTGTITSLPIDNSLLGKLILVAGGITGTFAMKFDTGIMQVFKVNS